MSDDQFTRLFSYMEKRFDEMQSALDDKMSKKQGEMLQRAVDNLVARTETDELERGALGSKVDRHKAWIKDLARVSKVKLQNS